MMDNRDIDHEIGRIVAGLIGLLLLASIGFRLWHWWAGGSPYETFWGAIAGRPLIQGRAGWDFGFWELYPDGQLAGMAMSTVVLSVLGGAILNQRSFYWVAVCVAASGYLVNAYLFLKLMATY